MKENSLIVLVGPTGVGKTELSLQLAEYLNCSIISSDSRQVFKELKIGTAAPDEQQLKRVKHYFVHTQSVTDYYSAGQFELDVLSLLKRLFNENKTQMMVGGSMLYIDAVCKGLDNIPSVSPELRAYVHSLYEEAGMAGLQDKLKELDPKHAELVDLNNKQRVMHAVEVSLSLGKPYSEMLGASKEVRPFNIIKIGLTLPRELLYERINRRVDIMMEEGLLVEAQSLYPFKQLNSLNTVGYKELFNYFDGLWTLDFAVNMIKQNSRRYAKRQLTWFNSDKEINWFRPDQLEDIIALIKKKDLSV